MAHLINKRCQHKADANTVALWHFNESAWDGTANEVKDASGNGNHGVAVGGVSTVAGYFGKCGDFDGTNDYVRLAKGALSVVLNGCAAITIEAWVKIDTLDDAHQKIILGNISNEFNGLQMLVWATTDQISVGGRSQKTDAWQSLKGSVLTTGIWYYLVGVLDFPNDKIKIYVNGLEDASGDVTFGSNTYVDSGTHTYYDEIGGDVILGTLCFDGLIDEVRISNFVRTPAEIAAYYRRQVGVHIL